MRLDITSIILFRYCTKDDYLEFGAHVGGTLVISNKKDATKRAFGYVILKHITYNNILSVGR